MPTEGTEPIRILADDEPVPFTVLNENSELPMLLVCDHASRRFPVSLGDLGVDPAVRRCHLAWDIGAGALTRMLAERLAATTVFQQYSRLVIDCNRQLLDPGAFLEFGDGVVVPGNRNLAYEHKQARADEIYWPYHYALAEELVRLRERSNPPSVYAIHSFTPVLNGISRECEIGILWDKDRRVSTPMVEALREHDYVVGDNEPYSGKAPQDFTIDHHAESAGLPHVGIEIRQDLIDDEAGVNEIADILTPVIEKIQAQLYPADFAAHRDKKPA